MAKKRIQKIPKLVNIKCPFCDYKMRLNVPIDRSIQSTECKSCEQLIRTPLTQCCVVCAFSDKKCPSTLIIEAKLEGLEIR
jgi:hypothetical protein